MSARSRAAPVSALLSLLLGAGGAEALSLRSSSAELFLGASPPGRTLRAERGLSVENAGPERVRLDAEAALPPPSRLRDGYEPLPDLGWLALTGRGRELEAGEAAGLEIAAAVPKDRSLEGRQFQFDCRIVGRAGPGRAAALTTTVLLAVGEPDPPDAPKEPDGSGFTVAPARARLEGVALGRRVDVDVGGAGGPMLANAGAEELVVRLSPMRAWDGSVRLEDGWTPAPNPRWLETGEPVTVGPGRVARARLALRIPDEERYRGRKFAFAVAVDAARGLRTGRTWWVLYARTE